MSRAWLLDRLRAHRPYDEEEAHMLRDMIAFVEREERFASRDTPAGHVTGSAWVVDRGRGHVLLVHHAALDRWFQPGGHVEEGETAFGAAWREAREEPGIRAITPLDEAVFDVDIHPIPARGSVPGHLHYDVRFLFEADRDEPCRASAESKSVEWAPLEEASVRNPDPSILRMAVKIARRAP